MHDRQGLDAAVSSPPSRTGFRWLWGIFYAVIALTTNQAIAAHKDNIYFVIGMTIIMMPIFAVLLVAQRVKLGFWNPLRVFRSD